MDYMEITCGVSGLGAIPIEKEKKVVQAVFDEATKAITGGYKIFQLGIVGPASLLYGDAVIDAIAERDGINLEVVLPHPNWIDGQDDATCYHEFMKKVHGFSFADTCYNPSWEMLVNNSVLDLSAMLIAITNGENEEVNSIVRIAEEIETPITKVEI